jgi:putative CocE/NonD family hydrolase
MLSISTTRNKPIEAGRQSSWCSAYRPCMLRIASVTSMLLIVATSYAQSSFVIRKGALNDSLTRSAFMAQLASDVMRGYEEPDRSKYLDTLFRLQLVAARFDDATKTIEELRHVHIEADKSAQSEATDFQYEVYSQARKLESLTGLPFAEAFAQAFHKLLPPLDDRISAMVLREWTAPLAPLQEALQQSVARQGSAASISREDAMLLLRQYQIAEAYGQMAPLLPELIESEDQRRYLIQRNVLVKTPDGASICTMVVRPRGVKTPLTALLNFTIYTDPRSLMNEARRTASNGYAGVEGLTRGKGCSTDDPVAYEHDGTDADILIDWIANQSWSDGRVGMFGGSYEGFTQWAASKHLPKALQAMMPSVSAAPGLDVPMEGNIFQTFVYYWPFYAATGHDLDNVSLNDGDRWQRMERNWYLSGKPYRDLDKIDGKPNPIFDKWLKHPSYDGYWQSMVPYRSDFARINIPVLTTTGYYDGGQISALHYFSQHYIFNPKAEHYLIIGPYDHIRGQRGTVSLLGDAVTSVHGYRMDAVAQIDLGELRYQWFDYVFKGGQKPAILQDRVNYEVMGANAWRHAPSLAAMSGQGVEFHLSGQHDGQYFRLQRTADGSFIPFQLDLSDRTDADRVSPSSGGIVDKHLDTWNSLAFISEPLSEPMDLSGLFQGRLDFVCNKRDFDLEIDLSERTPTGDYFQLSSFMARASYIQSQSVRHLLSPGAHEHLYFTNGRLTSRRLQAGSQVIVQIRIVKSPYAQINMGTGRDVSGESAADGKEPIRIRWFSTTSIKLPLSK